MYLIQNAEVYAPEALGINDVLIEGEHILAIEKHLEPIQGIPDLQVCNANGKRLIPGFIDLHEHLLGGGGEGGPWYRTPEAKLSTLVSCGVTTVLGLLGTDGTARNLEALLAKCDAFQHQGISAYALCGSYGVPPVTLSGSVERDIQLFASMVGVKTAMSDHRSSNPTVEELIRIATDARRGGLLSGKAGLVTIHMGSSPRGLQPLFEALDTSDLPVQNFLPTHMGRTEELFQQGLTFIARGGTIDLTVEPEGEALMKPAQQLAQILSSSTPDFVTATTDAYGSMPKFNEAHEMIGMTYSTPIGLKNTLKTLVTDFQIPLEIALKPFTSTPARMLGLRNQKGTLTKGADADCILLNADFEIDTVLARGKLAYANGVANIKGIFD